MFVAGAAIKWLRDGLRLIYDADEVDYYSKRVQDDQHVYLVPSFTGLGAPYWDSYSRGAIFGLERGTKREHIVKATVESIAYQSNDLIMAMAKDIKRPIVSLNVDGGAANSNYLMQFQASISNLAVRRPKVLETTALGAAYLAGLHVGFWSDIDELKKIAKLDKEFQPELDQTCREKLIKGWNVSVKKTLNWVKDIE